MKEKILKHVKKFKYVYIIVIIFVILGILIALKHNNPESTNIFPPCFIYKLTGIKCAGCGMTRAMHYLLNFEITKAFVLNPLLFVYIVYLIYVLVKYTILRRKNEKVSIDNYIYSLYIILIVTITFMFIRNIVNI